MTTNAVYQRRKRDPAFAAAMDASLGGTPRPTEKTPPPSEEQWQVFYERLRTGAVLRQAALAAGIRPEAVYDRRRTDAGFAGRTDRLRKVSR